MSIEDLQKRLDAVLSSRGQGPSPELAAAGPPPRRIFSDYDRRDTAAATALASRLMAIANEKGGEDGLAAAVDEVERALAAEERPGLVQHAVKLFITHHPEARERLRLGALEKRQPHLARPSKKTGRDEENGSQ